MDIKELNEWIGTEEGKAWAEALKAPLVAKRDELLASLHEANGRLAQTASRVAETEKQLADERTAVGKTVVDGELGRILKAKRVMEPAIPGLVAEMKETYGLTVRADGTTRKAFGMMKGEDGVEKEADLQTIVDAWSLSDAAAKLILIPASSGGGSLGPYPSGFQSRPEPRLENIGTMSAEDILANLPALSKRS